MKKKKLSFKKDLILCVNLRDFFIKNPERIDSFKNFASKNNDKRLIFLEPITSPWVNQIKKEFCFIPTWGTNFKLLLDNENKICFYRTINPINEEWLEDLIPRLNGNIFVCGNCFEVLTGIWNIGKSTRIIREFSQINSEEDTLLNALGVKSYSEK
jgi:hypothetical protein